MSKTEIPFYVIGSLRALVTFAVVAVALFLGFQFARRFNLLSMTVLQVMGPALPFSLLVASVTWSIFAAIELAITEEGLSAWMVVRGFPVMLMVAFVASPITILIGIPTCAIYFLSRRRVPPGVVYLYVVVVMALECVWYANVVNQL
jgi:hypothetical protein